MRDYAKIADKTEENYRNFKHRKIKLDCRVIDSEKAIEVLIKDFRSTLKPSYKEVKYVDLVNIFRLIA